MCRGKQVRVRFLDFRASDGSGTEEQLPSGFVRPAPPAPPAGWLDSLPEGAPLDIRHQEGWWAARLVGRKTTGSSSRSQVKPVKWLVTHATHGNGCNGCDGSSSRPQVKLLVVPAEGSGLPPLSERLVLAEDVRPSWVFTSRHWRMAHNPEVEVNEDAISIELQVAPHMRS